MQGIVHAEHVSLRGQILTTVNIMDLIFVHALTNIEKGKATECTKFRHPVDLDLVLREKELCEPAAL